jgi:MSHA biogenesis protein MshN
MGLFPMSLINQMLQELDARRSQVTGNDAYGKQIRAVPEFRRRIHPAWWVALALAIILSAVLAWIVLHSSVSGVSKDVARLPLKPDIGISSPGAQNPSQPVKAADAVAPIANAPNQPPPTFLASTRQRDVMPSERPANPPALVEEPAAPPRIAKEVPAAAMPELAKIVPPAKVLVKKAPPLPSTPAAPASASVPVKEITTQQRADTEYRKAISAMQQGRTAEAISGLEQSLELNPKHASARHALIGLLLENKRLDEAFRHAREGLALDPAQPGLAMIQARLQLERGELRPAIETLEQTLPAATNRADYHAFLAALLQRDEKHAQASKHYLTALQKAPQNGVWWMGLGISLQVEQRLPEAQEAFKRAKASNTLSAELLAFVEVRLKQLQR